MDPVSAFALACNVLQIVELSLKAAQKCKEIYRTGSLSEYDEIEKLTTNLRSANTDVESHISKTNLSPTDVRIKKLAIEANDNATALIVIFSQLKLIGKQNAGRALLQAIKTLSKRKPIEKLVQKLEKQDKALNSVILKDL